MTHAAALLALLPLLLGAADAPPAAASAPAAPAPGAPPATSAKPAPKKVTLQPASLPTAEGRVLAIDHRAHQLRLQTDGGERAFSFDRNTLFSDAAGAATPLRVTPGVSVRVGLDGEQRAAWVEVKRGSPTERPAP